MFFFFSLIVNIFFLLVSKEIKMENVRQNAMSRKSDWQQLIFFLLSDTILINYMSNAYTI